MKGGWAKWVHNASDILAIEEGCYFDLEAAQKVEKFFLLLRHSKGEWAGESFSLQPWQRDHIIYPLFGWKRANGTCATIPTASGFLRGCEVCTPSLTPRRSRCITILKPVLISAVPSRWSPSATRLGPIPDPQSARCPSHRFDRHLDLVGRVGAQYPLLDVLGLEHWRLAALERSEADGVNAAFLLIAFHAPAI